MPVNYTLHLALKARFVPGPNCPKLKHFGICSGKDLRLPSRNSGRTHSHLASSWLQIARILHPSNPADHRMGADVPPCAGVGEPERRSVKFPGFGRADSEPRFLEKRRHGARTARPGCSISTESSGDVSDRAPQTRREALAISICYGD